MKMHNLQEWDTSEIGTLWSSPNGVPISEVTLYCHWTEIAHAMRLHMQFLLCTCDDPLISHIQGVPKVASHV